MVTAFALCLLALSGCTSTTPEAEPQPSGQETPIDLFRPGALAQDVTTVDCTLSDGTATSCYEITVAGAPTNHDVGPFCPRTTSATEDEVGIWLDGEALYDVTGQFVLDLPTIYDDDGWRLYDSQGNVRVTDTREAFEAAARPDVSEEYENYCVEGRMEWLDGGEPVTTTTRHRTSCSWSSSARARLARLSISITHCASSAAAPR